MYDLGIIGGMGPLATAKIYTKIIEKTKASSDQEHMSIVVLNKPSIPDRSSAILNNGTSPVKSLNECIEELVKLDVKNFIIGCNTAHYFVDQLIIPKNINFINMIDEVLIKLKSIYKDKPIIVLSTIGTIKANIYKSNINAKDLNIIYPNDDVQTVIMDYIYSLKSGMNPYYKIYILENSLRKIKTIYPDAIFLLACTEISMLEEYLSKKFNVIDAVNVLADAVILKCGYQLSK